MDGFLMFSNVENVELLFIKFVDILNLENLNVNISYQKIKTPNFIINGDSVHSTRALIVLYVKQSALDLSRIFVSGAEEQNMLFVMQKISNVILEI